MPHPPARAALLLAAVVLLVAGLGNARAQPQPQLTIRARIPQVTREVLPDVAVVAVVPTEATPFSLGYTYRILNAGDDSADLRRFTLQAWFSADATLSKDVDLPAGLSGFTNVLAPGAVFEATTTSSNREADVGQFPYLILEVSSGGVVVESNLANNIYAARRPPADLLTSVTMTWEVPLARATVTWRFNGASAGIPDLGFRIEAGAFGTQEVPAGTTSVSIAFNPLTQARPCIARVLARRDATTFWPAVETNRLCE